MIDRNDLHALADNELSSEEQASLLRELESDANARVEYQNIVAMKTALKQSSTSPECGELWNRCQARLNELDKTKRVESFVGR